MKIARKRKPAKAGRRASKTTSARFLQENAGSALRRGRETIGRAYGWAQEAAEGTHLPHLRMPRRSDIGQLSEANPLLLGAVGLGLGVAIGTLFPLGMYRGTSRRTARASNGATAPAKAGRRRRKAKRAAAASA
jgi:hypothetical protein